MFEAVVIGVATRLLTKLASWIFKQAVSLVDTISYNKKVSDAGKEAIQNKRPSELEDLARGLQS